MFPYQTISDEWQNCKHLVPPEPTLVSEGVLTGVKKWKKMFHGLKTRVEWCFKSFTVKPHDFGQGYACRTMDYLPIK